MNKERWKAIVDRIKADPSCHYQGAWHCGTAHCFAGHAQIDSGKEPDARTAMIDAMKWLDISLGEANYYFACGRTLIDFERALFDAEHTSNRIKLDISSGQALYYFSPETISGP